MKTRAALVFPARAGMSPKPWRETMRKHRVPRASGDEPDFSQLANVIDTCSPRERG